MVGFRSVPQLVHEAGERFGPAPALVEADGRVTSFAKLAAGAASAARSLAEIGVRPGDRVLLIAGNSAATVTAWLGAIHLSALPAAVNPELTRAELDYLASDLGPAAVLSDLEREQPAAGLAAALRRPARLVEGLGGHGVAEPAVVDPLQPAAIVYTSGTTSRPKGVLVRHAAYTETGASFPGWIRLGAGERLWACLPMFHINAQAYSLMSVLAHGYSVAVTRRFHASTFWEEARRLEVTSVNVIGAMLTFLERQPPGSFVASRLKTVYAAPAPAPDRRGLLEQRFGVRITGGYGMSENTFGCAESPTSRDKPGCIGRPRQPASGAFRNEFRLVEGELCFRNPVMTPGYWSAEEVTARTLAGGWLHTGDAGHLDEDGDVFLSGRFKEMIRRRGENISPGEVEDALAAHPAVAAAAVFGVPSGATEEEVVAAVVLVPGHAAQAEELRSFARERLAAFKVPSAIVFRDSLPMTPTMRVAKDTLRSDYLAAQHG